MKQWHWITLVLLILISLIGENFVEHDPNHNEAWWSGIPFFYAIFSFMGCLLLILFVKYILKLIVHKEEDYYDKL